MYMNRRSYLAGIGTGVTGLFAGCSNTSSPFEYRITKSSEKLSITKLEKHAALKSLEIYISTTEDRAEHLLLVQSYDDTLVKDLAYGQTDAVIKTKDFSDDTLNEAKLIIGNGGTEEKNYNDMNEIARIEFVFYNTNKVSYNTKNVSTDNQDE